MPVLQSADQTAHVLVTMSGRMMALVSLQVCWSPKDWKSSQIEHAFAKRETQCAVALELALDCRASVVVGRHRCSVVT